MARKSRPSSSNARRRSRGGMSGPIIAKIAAGIAIPAMVIGGGAFGMHYIGGIETADANFCYQRDAQHRTAVFIDASLGELSAPVLRDYRTALIEAFDSAPANAKVMVFTTTGDVQATQARPVITMCRPPATPEAQASIGAPEETKPWLARRAGEVRSSYVMQVDRLLSDIQDKKKLAGDSPILEQVREISRYPDFQGPKRRFMWISDGVQNSEAGQFCKTRGHMPAFPRYAKRPGYAFLKPDSLAGTTVDVLLVEQGPLPHPALPFCTTIEVRNFWKSFF